MTHMIALVLAVVLAVPALARADSLPLEQVPAAVRAAIEREVGDGRLEEIERETRDGRPVYEVEFTRNNTEHEVLIAEDGTVLKRED
jgi:uncharacterized membrane protein YkoI